MTSSQVRGGVRLSAVGICIETNSRHHHHHRHYGWLVSKWLPDSVSSIPPPFASLTVPACKTQFRTWNSLFPPFASSFTWCFPFFSLSLVLSGTTIVSIQCHFHAILFSCLFFHLSSYNHRQSGSALHWPSSSIIKCINWCSVSCTRCDFPYRSFDFLSLSPVDISIWNFYCLWRFFFSFFCSCLIKIWPYLVYRYTVQLLLFLLLLLVLPS